METSLRHRGGVAPRSREWYLEAGREYVKRYGELTQACLNPAAAKRCGRPDLVDRYYAGRSDGTAWPSLNSIKKKWGSFNAYRADLGLKPNRTGGPPGGRRSPGEAEPILTVRERRVVVPSNSDTPWLRKQVEKAERRARHAEEELEAAKARTVEVPVVDTRTVDALRNRLADEKARRREVQRELFNAERRETRARTREAALVAAARGDSALLREVDRLSTRLAAAEGRSPATERAPRPRTVVKTKTVTVRDEVLVAQMARVEERAGELRAALARSEAHAAELAETLASVRRDAMVEVMAQSRVRAAERRALAAEKKATELAEILVGQRRVLTTEEVASLRKHGPAGHTVFLAMVKRLGRAEGTRAQSAALADVLAAAQNWRDRL